jgi:periplasmic protein CpxP/Spy
MKNRISLIVGIALAGLLAGAGISKAQEAEKKQGGDRREAAAQRVERMAEELKLTDAQKTKVKEVMEAQQKKMQEARTANPDATPEQRREAFRTAREEMAKKMKEILTPEQFTKWETMNAQRGPRGEGKKTEGKKEEPKKD